jgi:hypothetical protein
VNLPESPSVPFRQRARAARGRGSARGQLVEWSAVVALDFTALLKPFDVLSDLAPWNKVKEGAIEHAMPSESVEFFAGNRPCRLSELR